MASRRAALRGNTSLIATFASLIWLFNAELSQRRRAVAGNNRDNDREMWHSEFVLLVRIGRIKD